MMDMKLTRRLLGYFRPYRILFICTITLMIIAKMVEAYVPIAIGSVTDMILGDTGLFSTVIQQSVIILFIFLFVFGLDVINVLL